LQRARAGGWAGLAARAEDRQQAQEERQPAEHCLIFGWLGVALKGRLAALCHAERSEASGLGARIPRCARNEKRIPAGLLEWSVAEQHLWAPWRLAYIKGEKEPGCIFCTRLARSDDANDLILHRGTSAFVILNAFPYTNGHLMIVPFLHTSDLEDLAGETLAEMDQLLKRSIAALKAAFGPNGFNIGWNIGRCAGAGVEDHIHEHVVPRWNGDTNFMPVLTRTMVMPEMLVDTYRALKVVF